VMCIILRGLCSPRRSFTTTNFRHLGSSSYRPVKATSSMTSRHNTAREVKQKKNLIWLVEVSGGGWEAIGLRTELARSIFRDEVSIAAEFGWGPADGPARQPQRSDRGAGRTLKLLHR
jgi:hypothetical protein